MFQQQAGPPVTTSVPEIHIDTSFVFKFKDTYEPVNQKGQLSVETCTPRKSSDVVNLNHSSIRNA
jgi:hypothetical protein